MQRYWVIIPAAGIGQRMNVERPKQYLHLLGKTILEHTLSCFLAYPHIEKIIVVVAENDLYWPSLNLLSNPKILTATGGGKRFESVLSGLHKIAPWALPNDWILVHDAARPCLQHQDIDRLIQQLQGHVVGGLLGIPVADTLKKNNPLGEVMGTMDRHDIWQALTPQMFRYQKLINALQYCMEHHLNITDSSSALEILGEKPLLVRGRRDNIKITYPDDLLLAEQILMHLPSKYQYTEFTPV